MSWDEASGFTVVESVLSSVQVSALIDEAECLFAIHGRRPAGVRDVLRRSNVIRQFAEAEQIRGLVTTVLGTSRVRAVRAILFDKSPEANWDVVWHQDTTIAVAERHDVSGFGPWSLKKGIPHVRPPRDILEQMITVRLHLDDCGVENGALLVASGSHRHGIEDPPHDIARLEASAVTCGIRAGGALLMRPLLFHASRKAVVPRHRRVIHLEYAGCALPSPLVWSAMCESPPINA